MDATPIWRQGFDAAGSALGPRLATLVASDGFAVGVGLVLRARYLAQQAAERETRRVLHLLNLPAGSDVTRILREIGRLQVEMRELAARVQ